MPRALHSIAYLGTLLCSTTAAALAFRRLLPMLPAGALGLAVLILIVTATSFVVASIESSISKWRWLRPSSPRFDATTKARSLLLVGNAPAPLALGVVIGAFLAIKL